MAMDLECFIYAETTAMENYGQLSQEPLNNLDPWSPVQINPRMLPKGPTEAWMGLLEQRQYTLTLGQEAKVSSTKGSSIV
jgi:hypothetical protein